MEKFESAKEISKVADRISPEARSENMSKIRNADTGPEMTVRRLVHSMGYRYRLHKRDLPGCPDLVFPAMRKAIFVHGCFWHRHQGCKYAYTPKSRVDFWISKLEGNRIRDVKNLTELEQLGWKVLTVWECEIVDADLLRDRINRFLLKQ
jgi:DNA mismatch endonuclease (patch repair protein)